MVPQLEPSVPWGRFRRWMELSLMREAWAGEEEGGLALGCDFAERRLSTSLRFGVRYEGRGRSSNVSRGVEKRSGEGQRAGYGDESSASEESDMSSSCGAAIGCDAYPVFDASLVFLQKARRGSRKNKRE